MDRQKAIEILKSGAWWASLDCCIGRQAKSELTEAIALAVAVLAGKGAENA
ncbi:MAG: hypothetical protein [Chaetfec virus UA24_244]|nr:MAG: hypothetical protein [Chaetfec virus UA24_244]